MPTPQASPLLIGIPADSSPAFRADHFAAEAWAGRTRMGVSDWFHAFGLSLVVRPSTLALLATTLIAAFSLNDWSSTAQAGFILAGLLLLAAFTLKRTYAEKSFELRRDMTLREDEFQAQRRDAEFARQRKFELENATMLRAQVAAEEAKRLLAERERDNYRANNEELGKQLAEIDQRCDDLQAQLATAIKDNLEYARRLRDREDDSDELRRELRGEHRQAEPED